MKALNIRNPAALFAILLSFSLGQVWGQPATLTLKAKVRDFKEAGTTANVHPNFFGDRAYPKPCDALNNHVNTAQLEIDTTDDIGDTSVFKGDNRGPRLLAALDPKVAGCFEPVNRFGSWYNDSAAGDINRSFLIDVQFTWNAATHAYEYFNDSFFPLDNGKTYQKLDAAKPPFGNLLAAPNDKHDFGFTLEFHTRFTYFKGQGQVFKFTGDDDVWVFINGKRVIDLGGIHGSQDASFNLDAIASANGLQDSLVYPLDFFFAERHTTTSKLRISTTLQLDPVLANPVVPDGGFFEDQTTITITHPSPDATIYYTTDGSTPTVNSPKYTGPITLSETTTLKVIAVRPGYRNSDVVTETYTKMETVSTPAADPKGKVFVTPPQTVTLSVATPGAVIHYTVDGSDPTEASPVYQFPISFNVTTTVKAKAFLANWVPSALMTEVYTDAATLVPPVADPGSGSFVGSQTVSLSVPGHPDAEIRYTLDGTEPTATSPHYAGPLTFTGTTTLKAKAFLTNWQPSQTMTNEYGRLASTVKAVYVDADGNGSIDGAVIHLDTPAASLPASVKLTDPVSKVEVTFPSNYISKGATNDILIVSFLDKQFLPGTTFTPQNYGAFPEVPGYDPAPFQVSDSAGPVPVEAVSHNKTTPEDQPSVDITFSEPIDLKDAQTGPAWPFDVIRNGDTAAGAVKVVSITLVPGKPNTYRWTFEAGSPVYPVYIDSLVVAAGPALKDALGTPAIPGGKKIKVQGSPQNLVNKIVIQVTNLIEPGRVTANPTLNQETRNNPFGAVGTSTDGSDVCLACPAGSDLIFTQGPPLPEWVIKSKYGFRYSFNIYDHLGNFVSRTEGQITDAMMAKLAQDKDGFRSLRFRWIPVAHDGTQVGTGAYILKGNLVNHDNEAQKGSQGEPQTLKQTQTVVFSKFGFLRQH